MARIRIQRSVLRWGHGYGLRLTKAEMEKLGIGEKETVDADIEAREPEWNPERLHFVRLGRDASLRHDEIIAEGSGADS